MVWHSKPKLTLFVVLEYPTVIPWFPRYQTQFRKRYWLTWSIQNRLVPDEHFLCSLISDQISLWISKICYNAVMDTFSSVWTMIKHNTLQLVLPKWQKSTFPLYFQENHQWNSGKIMHQNTQNGITKMMSTPNLEYNKRNKKTITYKTLPANCLNWGFWCQLLKVRQFIQILEKAVYS